MTDKYQITNWPACFWIPLKCVAHVRGKLTDHLSFVLCPGLESKRGWSIRQQTTQEYFISRASISGRWSKVKLVKIFSKLGTGSAHPPYNPHMVHTPVASVWDLLWKWGFRSFLRQIRTSDSWQHASSKSIFGLLILGQIMSQEVAYMQAPPSHTSLENHQQTLQGKVVRTWSCPLVQPAPDSAVKQIQQFSIKNPKQIFFGDGPTISQKVRMISCVLSRPRVKPELQRLRRISSSRRSWRPAQARDS